MGPIILFHLVLKTQESAHMLKKNTHRLDFLDFFFLFFFLFSFFFGGVGCWGDEGGGGGGVVCFLVEKLLMIKAVSNA